MGDKYEEIIMITKILMSPTIFKLLEQVKSLQRKNLIHPQAVFRGPTAIKCIPFQLHNLIQSQKVNFVGGPLYTEWCYADIDEDCQISSLQGLPITYINGYLNLYNKPELTSLEGLPVYMTGDDGIELHNIGITNLKGMPAYISGRLLIIDCDNLTSLEGIPKYVGHLCLQRSLLTRLIESSVLRPWNSSISENQHIRMSIEKTYGCRINDLLIVNS